MAGRILIPPNAIPDNVGRTFSKLPSPWDVKKTTVPRINIIDKNSRRYFGNSLNNPILVSV